MAVYRIQAVAAVYHWPVGAGILRRAWWWAQEFVVRHEGGIRASSAVGLECCILPRASALPGGCTGYFQGRSGPLLRLLNGARHSSYDRG
jgi:hypothetical protein